MMFFFSRTPRPIVRTYTDPTRWPWPQKPHTCPVCGGKGQVRPGFYNVGRQVVRGDLYGNTGSDLCRTCKGNGIVWEP